MLELYHSINSVCAQKVRVVLAEKGLEYGDRLMTLRGDQFDPEYMQLNPNAVVPTLVHDPHFRHRVPAVVRRPDGKADRAEARQGAEQAAHPI